MDFKLIELTKRFQKLADITGRSKSSSYSVGVSFPGDDEVIIHLGTYDIGDWHRHTYIETTVNNYLTDLENKIIEAEKVIMSDLFTIYVGKKVCPYCDKAKSLLHYDELPFQVKVIDSQEILDSIQKSSGVEVKTVPQIFHGDKYIGGYTELEEYLKGK